MNSWSAGLAVAGLILAVPTLALADEATPDASPSNTSDLAAAIAPLAAASDSGAATEKPCGLPKWLGLPARDADAFDDFARPITNIQFHHPFVRSEARFLFVHHWFPDTSVVDGGWLRAYALQINAKLTDELVFTAYKDGFVELEADGLPDGSGFADIAIGLKYKAWEDVESSSIFSVGLGYELTWPGDEEVLEGEGDGFADLYGSYATKFGDVNFIGTAGIMLPKDSDEDVRTAHWHMHVDFPTSDGTFAPLLEVNAFHYLDDAERNAGFGPTVPLKAEAFDYTTLGSGGVDGHTAMTIGAGFRWSISDDITFGAAYEVPLGGRTDLLDRRLTMDLVFRF